jgi:hypothetical protein
MADGIPIGIIRGNGFIGPSGPIAPILEGKDKKKAPHY